MTQEAAQEAQYKDWETSPYRSFEQDFELWKRVNPKQFKAAMAILKDKNPTGVNWDSHSEDWDEFIDRDDVVLLSTLRKDMNAQRPINFDSVFKIIVQSDGIFDHAQASAIDVAYREDGSQNTWDHWHTGFFGYCAGVSHAKISKLSHRQKTLEESRDTELEMFEKRNVFNLKTSAGITHEFKVKRVRKTNVSPFDPDVCLSKIFVGLNITTTGSKPSHTKLKGIEKMKGVRLDWQKHLKDNAKADKQVTLLLKTVKEVFPDEAIDATIIEALSYSLITFANVEKFNVPSIREFLEEQKRSGNFPKMTSYNTKAVKVKGNSKESVALFFVYTWNNWMFDTKTSKKRPITIKVASNAFRESFPEEFINSVWVHSTQEFVVTCGDCGKTWDEKVKV